MNALIQMAQLQVSEATTNADGRKTFKVSKPQTGQAVSFHLDGKSVVDLTSFADEKITLVRLGDRLVILFDNQSTVSIDPVFDNNGAARPEVAFEMAPDRILNGDQFAQLFPITSDQSVLPAAGTPGAPSMGAGANFGSFTIDALTSQTALDLVADEEVTQTSTDIQPAANSKLALGVADVVVLDDEGLAGGILDGLGDIPGAATSVTGSLHVDFGTDVIGRGFAFKSAQPGLAGLKSGGEAVNVAIATVAGQPTLIGYVGSDPSIAAHRVFTISLDAASTTEGTYTVTLLRPLDHPISGTEDTLSLRVNVIAIDGSGDTAPLTITINVNDNSPVTKGAV